MDYLLELLSNYFHDETQRRLVFLTLTGFSIFLFCGGLIVLVSSLANPMRRRLAAVLVGSSSASSPHTSQQAKLANLLAPTSRYVLPKKEDERTKMYTKLMHAGFTDSSALTTFYALKTLLAIACPLAALWATRYFPDLTNQRIILFVAIAGFVGVMAPNSFVERKKANRQRRLRVAFPDALDLLVVCVESGLGIVAALQRVAEDLDVSHPELAEELKTVNAEIRLGVTRVEALKNMAYRTGLEEVDSLVVLLDQSARFGTSIAEALRVYAEEFRDKRMQAAEEQAAKISTKLIFPLTFCMWPAFFLVAIGPAILKMIDAFSRM